MNLLDSHIEAGQALPEEDRRRYYTAIVEYLYYGREPELEGPALAVFIAIRPTLDISKAKAESGSKGGSKTQAKRKQAAKQTPSKPPSKTEADAKQAAKQTASEGEEEEDKDPKGSITPIPPYAEVVKHLNEAAGKAYRADSAATRDLIRARFDEGFALEDFRRVIDNKCASWLGDPKMEPYLRPETLFRRGHFESYLNERPPQGKEDGLGKYDD